MDRRLVVLNGGLHSSMRLPIFARARNRNSSSHIAPSFFIIKQHGGGRDQVPETTAPFQHLSKGQPRVVVRQRRRTGRAGLVSSWQMLPEFHVAPAQPMSQLQWLRHRTGGQAIHANGPRPGAQLQPERRLELGRVPLQTPAAALYFLLSSQVQILLGLAGGRIFWNRTQASSKKGSPCRAAKKQRRARSRGFVSPSCAAWSSAA